jgi:hypothetical protein
MMRQLISRFVGKEVAERWSLLRTAALITLRPSAFSERIATEEADVVLPSSRFFSHGGWHSSGGRGAVLGGIRNCIL